MIMHISVILTLTSATDAILPAHLGPANYAATLAAPCRARPGASR